MTKERGVGQTVRTTKVIEGSVEGETRKAVGTPESRRLGWVSWQTITRAECRGNHLTICSGLTDHAERRVNCIECAVTEDRMRTFLLRFPDHPIRSALPDSS